MASEVDIEELELELEVAPDVAPPPPDAGEGRTGRYHLVRRLGSGGMAEVWLAEDAEHRSFAVKIFSPRDPDPQGMARFRREYLALRRLSHPGIVAVHDAGVHAGRPFFVMDFVDGHDLRREARLLAALPTEARFGRIRDLFVQLCEALAYVHSAGLVHRDLKPSNVLVGPDGRVCLTDFGIARDLTDPSTLTAPGQFLGTVAYIAPEQIQGLPVDPRADLYSLGVLLYELLTGQRPFHASDSVGWAYLHVHRAPTPPRSIDDAIPPRLEAVALKLLHKNPSDRFASCQEALSALEGAEAELPVTLPRPALAPWVGRRAELDSLQDLLVRPAERCGQIVVVEGPFGMGKTRLVREVLLRLPLEGVGTLEGYCSGLGTPYEGFQNVVAAALKELMAEGDRKGQQLVQRLKPALDWAFATAFGEDPPTVLELRLERYRTATALVELLVFLGVRRPRVIFIDEIQRGDRATRELAAHLARELSTRHVPVVLVVTVEPGDTPPLPLISRKQHPLVIHLGLSPMQPEEIQTLLRMLLGSAPLTPLEELGRGAQGRPGFAVELAHAWRAMGRTVEQARELPPVPPVVREAILESLTWIHMPGVEILALLSALGREATPTFLRQALAKKEAVLAKRLEQLEREGWLTVRQWDGAERWDLPSWVARKVVYEALSESTRYELHLRLATALGRDRSTISADDLSSLADQLHQAGRFDDAWPRHIEAAVVMLERRSARAALTHLNRAEAIADRLTHTDDDADSLREQRARMLRLKGQAEVAIGQTSTGLRSLQACVKLSERLDAPHILAMGRYALATAMIELGMLDDAEPLLIESADAWIESGEAVGLAATRVSQAELYMQRGKPGQSEAPLREAMALARKHDSRSVLADALMISGMAGFARGDGTAAMDLLIASEAEYRSIQARTGLTQCLTSRSEIAWWLGDVPGAISTSEEAATLARETDLRLCLVRAQLVIGLTRFERGSWDDAAALFEHVVSLCRRPGYKEQAACAQVWRAWVALGRGDPTSALGWLELVDGDNVWARCRKACRAWALAALGHAEEARALVAHLEEGQGPLAPRVILRIAMGWTYLLLGEAEQARGLARRAINRADRMGLRSAGLQACLLLQAIAVQQGSLAEARIIRHDIDFLVDQLSAGLPAPDAQALRNRPDLLLPETEVTET